MCLCIRSKKPARLGYLRGAMDSAANARIGRAATDVSGKRPIDVVVGRIRFFFEQGRRAHDLSGLTVAALRYFDFNPGPLQRMVPVGREPFDGGDLFAYRP